MFEHLVVTYVLKLGICIYSSIYPGGVIVIIEKWTL